MGDKIYNFPFVEHIIEQIYLQEVEQYIVAKKKR